MATIVIHSKTKDMIFGLVKYQWSGHKIFRRHDGRLKIESYLLDKDEAKTVIDKFGLIVVHKTEDGEVYDTPEQNLKTLFPSGLRRKEDILEIEKIDKL